MDYSRYLNILGKGNTSRCLRHVIVTSQGSCVHSVYMCACTNDFDKFMFYLLTLLQSVSLTQPCLFICQMPEKVIFTLFQDTYQWRIQDFPDGGAPTPEGGAPTYYLTNFSQKLHENEENLTQRGGRASLRPPLDPPMPTFFPSWNSRHT